MIKIEKIKTLGWEDAIRGMRNPMNSWEKSDSVFYYPYCYLRQNDHILAMSLAKSGTDHAKFRRMIIVSCDITAPLYWWKEFDTYKVGTVANSCSTMHKIHEKEFALGDFSYEHLSNFSSHPEDVKDPITILSETIKTLNSCRECYLKEHDKYFWWQMIQLLPSSYNQKRTVMLNYEVLANIYKSRKDHKLDEWRKFCEVMKKSCQYSELFTLEMEENEDE